MHCLYLVPKSQSSAGSSSSYRPSLHSIHTCRKILPRDCLALLFQESLGVGLDFGGSRSKDGAVDRGRTIKCLVKHFWHLEFVLMAPGKMECEGKLAEECVHRGKQSKTKIRTIAVYIKQLRRKQPRLENAFKAPLMFQYAWSICPLR